MDVSCGDQGETSAETARKLRQKQKMIKSKITKMFNEKRFSSEHVMQNMVRGLHAVSKKSLSESKSHQKL